VTVTPAATFSGDLSVTFTVRDDGTTAGSTDPQSASAQLTVSVTPKPKATGCGCGATDPSLVFLVAVVLLRRRR